MILKFKTNTHYCNKMIEQLKIAGLNTFKKRTYIFILCFTSSKLISTCFLNISKIFLYSKLFSTIVIKEKMMQNRIKSKAIAKKKESINANVLRRKV